MKPVSHTLKSYDDELNHLRTIISQMGGLAEAQLASAVTALVERDLDLARRAQESDSKIDRMETEIEHLAVDIIARRAPVADDLRDVLAAMKIATMLERMGDYSKNIAKRATVLAKATPIRPLSVLPHMASEARKMIMDVLDAYIERDAERAGEVWAYDSRVDALYDSFFRELLTYMMEKPQLITPCTHLLFIAKNIERVGDQATNIAEAVYFSITGKTMPDNRPKGDRTAFANLTKSDDRA